MTTFLRWLALLFGLVALVQASGDPWVLVAAMLLAPILCPLGWLCWYGQPGPRSSELGRRLRGARGTLTRRNPRPKLVALREIPGRKP